MKEAFVNKGPTVVIKDVPIPNPTTPDHLIIKVVVSGSNPKDWKIAERVVEGMYSSPLPQFLRTLTAC
jgi:NADPH:quinone reductase